MALTKCPECNKKVSNKATVCIHCGYPLTDAHVNDKTNKKQRKKSSKLIRFAKWFCGISLTFVALVIALAISMPEPTAEDKLNTYITKYSLSNECKEIIMQYLPDFENFSKIEQSGESGFNIYLKDGSLYYFVIQKETKEPVCLMSSESDYESRTRYYDKFAKE